MKKIFRICLLGALVLGAAACKKSEESYPLVEAIVTVKTASDQSCYLQLNDEVALVPTNDSFKKNPYGKEVRAYVIYSDKGPVEGVVGYQWRSVTLNLIDTILTKKPVEGGQDYGDAPIEIYDNWMTVMEDGYLTLNFEGLWGASDRVHRINLVKSGKPGYFTLCHDNAGDFGTVRHSGLVAFDMHEYEDPGADEYDFYVNYQGYAAAKTLRIHYKDGKYTISREDSKFE